jgi:MFS family permease
MGLQSIFAIGSVICIIFIPIISDSKGKKFAFFLALLAMLIGDIGLFLGTFNKIYFLIGICELLCAGSNAAMAVSYSINSDFFSDDLRQKSVIYYCIVW